MHQNEHIQITKENHLTSAQLCPRPVNIGTFLVSVMYGAYPYGALAYMIACAPNIICVCSINERAVVALNTQLLLNHCGQLARQDAIMLPSMIHGAAVSMEIKKDYNY